MELTNEMQLRKEQGWYRASISVKQQSVNEWIVVRNRKKAIGINIHVKCVYLAIEESSKQQKHKIEAQSRQVYLSNC